LIFSSLDDFVYQVGISLVSSLTLTSEPRVIQPKEITDQDASVPTLQGGLEPTTSKTKRPIKHNPVTSADTGAATINSNSSDRVELLDVDPNSGRKKRRKTAENKAGAEGTEDQTETARHVPKRQSRQRRLPGTVETGPSPDTLDDAQLVDTKHEGAWSKYRPASRRFTDH